jgi:hypothetical protein
VPCSFTFWLMKVKKFTWQSLEERMLSNDLKKYGKYFIPTINVTYKGHVSHIYSSTCSIKADYKTCHFETFKDGLITDPHLWTL